VLSLKLKLSVEPTLVVAIAAALANVGAGIEVNDAPVKVARVCVEPPQAVSIKLAPLSVDAKGKRGAPANV
jgi:hypothetical protein